MNTLSIEFALQRILLLVLVLLANHNVNADPVVETIDTGDFVHSPSDNTIMTTDAGTYQVLVIPVVTSDTPYTTSNNSLDSWRPGLQAEIIAEWDTVKEYWLKETHNEIEIETDVIGRFFQLPEPRDFYFNPAYIPVSLSAGASLPLMPAMPAGVLTLIFKRSSTDQIDIPLVFDADAVNLTRAEIITVIRDQITSQVGDQIVVSMPSGRILFSVADRFVEEDTELSVAASSSEAVLEALSLTSYERNIIAGVVTSVGLELPLSLTADSIIEFTADYDGVSQETVQLTLPMGSYSTISMLQSELLTPVSTSVSVAGQEIMYTLGFPNLADITSISVNVMGGGLTLDDIGLDEMESSVGVVRQSKSNTVKGDRRNIAGQAIGAYMIDELSSATLGALDDITDISFTSANEAALRASFVDNIDPYHAVVALFLDADKRGGASGSWLPIRIENDGFVFDHTTVADLQVYYESDGETVALHETGHNIGFPDIYNNGNGNYDPMLLYPNQWEQMANQREYPSVGGYLRSIYSDWLTRTGGTIRTFFEPTMPASSERREFLLTPLEVDPAIYDNVITAPAGRELAKVIKIPLSSNSTDQRHSLVVQNRQEHSHSDSDYPVIDGVKNGGLYITDTISPDLFDYFLTPTRNFSHPLTDKVTTARGNVEPIVDADPAVDIDIAGTFPAYDGIEIDIVGELAGPDGRPSLLVDVTREQADYLDLSITPWSAPPWESNDIWIERGDKELSDLSPLPLSANGEQTRWLDGYNPAANNGEPLNWIRVKITNNGTVDATDVELDVKINSPGGLGDTGSWNQLPSIDRKNISANGGSAIFNIPWNPTINEHTCIKVQIFRWNATVGEINFANNQTQENIVDFNATSGSPWKPSKFEFEIDNPFTEALPIELAAENLPYGMKVNFDKTFIDIPPKTKIRSGGVLIIDSEVYDPPTPDGFGNLNWTVPRSPVVPGSKTFPESDPDSKEQPARGEPIKQQIHISGYAIVDGHSRVQIGGITLNTALQKESTVKLSVSKSRNGLIVVQGFTEPAAGNEEAEVIIIYPSGQTHFIPVKTDAKGNISIETKAVSPGKVDISLRPGQRGQFALQPSNRFILDPDSGDFEEFDDKP